MYPGWAVREAGEPVVTFALQMHILAVSSSPVIPLAIDVSTCVPQIIRYPQRGRRGERLEGNQLLVAHAGWKPKTFILEDLDCLTGGAYP